MAISNQFIREFLFNYWDTHGSLDGLSKNAKRIYQLIIDRRKKQEDKRPVNDYIYSCLGVTPVGRLGEELTFELRNHVKAYYSLKNVKSCKSYNKLVRLAESNETTVDELLIEAGLGQYLDVEPNVRCYSDTNTFLILCSNILKSIVFNPKNPAGLQLKAYYESTGTFQSLESDLPEVYEYLDNLVKFEFGEYLDEDATNADGVMIGTRLYLKKEGDSAPVKISKTVLIRELLYLCFGYVPNHVLPPSARYMIKCHLDYYKTLYGMVRTNPNLYNLLISVYVTEGKYSSLSDMLLKEGYYYPELTCESMQYHPCDDGEHIVGVLDSNDCHFILDRKTMAYVFENEFEDKLSVQKTETLYYLAIAIKNKKKVEYLPFHVTYTGFIDTVCLDGNYLNLSSANILASQ